MRIVRALAVAVILIVLTTSHRVGAQGPATYTDLGTLGGTQTLPIGMNDLGDVVGQSSLAGDMVFLPFVWSGGVMQPLPLLPGLGHTTGHARAINNLGQSVGVSSPPGFNLFSSRAVRWVNGVPTDLNTAATAAAGWVSLAFAFDINDAGQIVGLGFKAGNVQRAFLLTNGIVTDLGTLGGATAAATSVNNAGQVSGLASIDAAGNQHAFTWTNGVMTDLGGSTGDGFNLAQSINDFGEAAGSWASAAGAVPLFWDATGTPTQLPLFGANSFAIAINNLRQIVGAGSGKALLWEGGAVANLETLVSAGVPLASANAINNAGQVAVQTGTQRGGLIQLPTRASTVSALIGSLVVDAEVANSLLAKLGAATNGGAPVCNVLRAARNEVNAQSGKKIPSDVATRLLDTIDAARANCP